MGINNQMYKVGEINLPGIDNPLKTAGLQESLASYISGTNPDLVLKKINGSNRIGIYLPHQRVDSQLKPILDPLSAILNEFKNENSENWPSVESVVYDHITIMKQDIRDEEVRNLGDSVKRLQREAIEIEQSNKSLTTISERSQRRYESAEATVDELRLELGNDKTALDESKKYASGLEQQITSSAGNFLEVFGTREDFGSVLGGNEELYIQVQENIIAHAFYQVSDEIDKREMYEKMEEVNDAKIIVHERQKYLIDHGQGAIDDLSPTVRELNQLIYDNAVNSIEEYFQNYNEITPLTIPVRIAKTSEETVIVMPVSPKSENVFAKALYDDLVSYASNLQSQSDLEAAIDYNQPFATIRIAGKLDDKTLVDGLMDVIGEYAKENKLNLETFFTNYFDGVPKEKEVSVTQNVNPAEIIKSRILGFLEYSTLKDFSADNQDMKISDILHRIKEGSNLNPNSIDRLAESLKMESSDLKTILKNYFPDETIQEDPVPQAIHVQEDPIPPPVSDQESNLPQNLDGANYLSSLVTGQYGTLSRFQQEEGISIYNTLSRIRKNIPIRDNTIKEIAGKISGVRWDTIKRNIRPK